MKIRRPVCVLSLVFMLISGLYTYASGGVDLSEKNSDSAAFTVDGIIEDKAYKNFSDILYIKACNAGLYRTSKFVVYLNSQHISDFKIGQSVRITGKYSNFPVAENKGQFCMRTYYRIRGYEARLKKAEVTHISGSFSAYRDFLYNIKEHTKSIYKNSISEEHFGTVCAMILGDKSDLYDETKTLYQNAGMSHILSLSGLHIAAIGMFIFSMLIKAGAGTYISSGISAVVMVSYGIMTGLSTSTFRALIMFFLGIIARCIGRTYDLLSAVCISAMIILLENPLFIYDSGFLMSFLSVIGIGIIYPVLNEVTELRVFSGYYNSSYNKDGGFNIFEAFEGFFSKIRQSICISMSASLATLPVVASSFFKISRYGIFANIIIVPLMSVVLFLGIAGGTVGWFAGGFADDAIMNGGGLRFSLHNFMRLLFYILEKLLDLFNDVSGYTGSMTGNMWVIGKPGRIEILVYIILITITFSGLGKKAVQAIINKKRERLFKLTYFLFMVIMTAAALYAISFRNENDFQIDVLSIGQGACNVVHGKDIPTIMIDAGSSDVKEAGKYRVIPNLLSKGIDEIDYIFVTHPDEDHISAVKELLSDKTCGIRADAVVFSIVDDSITELYAEYGVPVYSFNEGQIISGSGYEIRAVYPACRDGITWQGEDANENSLVLKITHKPTGFTALFTGDIGTKAEEIILKTCEAAHESSAADGDGGFSGNLSRNGSANGSVGNAGDGNERVSADIKNIDFMTIAHHGSKNSSSDQFLAYTNPLICTISAGKDNSYGHPHKETLERLTDHDLPYLITYETGEISLNIDDGKAWVENYLN